MMIVIIRVHLFSITVEHYADSIQPDSENAASNHHHAIKRQYRVQNNIHSQALPLPAPQPLPFLVLLIRVIILVVLVFQLLSLILIL